MPAPRLAKQRLLPALRSAEEAMAPARLDDLLGSGRLARAPIEDAFGGNAAWFGAFRQNKRAGGFPSQIAVDHNT